MVFTCRKNDNHASGDALHRCLSVESHGRGFLAPSFDLLSRPWLIVGVNGRTEAVGLRTLFQEAHRFDDLAISLPPGATGLWRILYAIAARVTGLDDPGLDAVRWTVARQAVAQQGAFDPVRVDEYFDRWSARFDLFHPERPWLQDPRLRVQCAKPSGINKLAFDRPAGSNQVWFGHFTDAQPESIPAADAALYLIAQLYFGASGRCTTRTVGPTTESNTNAGPLRQMLSYHPIGRSVFETLLAGLPQPSHRPLDSGSVGDECPWESDELADPLGAPRAASWPGGMLTTRQRHAVLLVPDALGEAAVDSYVTWAWRTPATTQQDLYAIGHLSKEEQRWYGRRADSDRALWRDLDSLLRIGNNITGEGRPKILGGCQNLPYVDNLRIRAFGFDQDGQTRDRQWFVATTPPVLGWMEEVNPGSAMAVEIVRKAAEQVGSQLMWALREAWKTMTHKDGQWTVRAASYYWPRAEEAFWSLAENPSAENLTEPLRPFVHIGESAIEYAIGSRDRMPVARAFNEAQRRLHAVLSQGERK
jgi:CRISPR system Cascade subunit CasA